MKLSNKGGATIDRVAHTLMDFNPPANVVGATYKDGYMAFYHEERLYSVRNMESGVVSLVYAGNPYEAIEKCARPGKWIKAIIKDRVRCSVCRYEIPSEYEPKRYCPNCGAKMEGGKP